MQVRKIKRISESFSMQPESVVVGYETNGRKVNSITKQTIDFWVTGNPHEYEFYVSKDEHGEVICQHRAEAMNVFFD